MLELETYQFEPTISSKLLMFKDYFNETWFSNGDDGIPVSLFRRWEWNHYENDDNRTYNHNEAYNGKLESIINKADPSIWEFISKIKSEDTH